MKGILVSPRKPSRIDEQTDKAARLDHLMGLGVEFTDNVGTTAWEGSPYQDHARVSFAVKVRRSRPKATSEVCKNGIKNSG
jgi:hypothetical protein